MPCGLYGIQHLHGENPRYASSIVAGMEISKYVRGGDKWIGNTSKIRRRALPSAQLPATAGNPPDEQPYNIVSPGFSIESRIHFIYKFFGNGI